MRHLTLFRCLQSSARGQGAFGPHKVMAFSRFSSTPRSVDPPNAMDIDDVLHAIEIAPGRYEVGVHIADVGYFVKEGSALDEEAQKRGTTCYLVDSRLEMLPKRLSHDLCSLHEGVDRLAFSVLWEMDEGAHVLSPPRFEKTIIRSAASLTYGEAQRRIDDTTNDDEASHLA